MTRTFPHWTLLLLMFVIGLSSAGFAQFNAAIQGTVTDSSGAVVPNAAVTATNQATGVVARTQTTGSGVYRISGLPPGTYTVTVEAQSFSPHTDKDLQVAAEQPRGLDVKLAIG